MNGISMMEVARRLGIPFYKIRYAHYSGQLAEPEWGKGRRVYTEADVARVATFFGIVLEQKGN
jgi:DNA-binding transcriptional MerR regulator